jgi:hypothetical protein
MTRLDGVIDALLKIEPRGSGVDSGSISPLRRLVGEVTIGGSVCRLFRSLGEILCFLAGMFERVVDREGVQMRWGENLRGEVKLKCDKTLLRGVRELHQF